MKKQFLHNLTLLLCALVAGSISGWGETESITLSSGSFSTDHITWSGTSVTIQQTKGTSTTAVNSSYVSAPRVYKGHILSFEAKSGYIIKSISITYDSSYKGNSMTAGIALDGNTVTDNPTAVNRTWSTASSGTHLVSSASDDGHAAIYIQNVCGSSSTDNVQLRPTAISINYDVVVVPSHTATFSINGITTSDDIVEGESIIFPTNPVIDGH